MTEPDGKADLRRYLRDAREALLWKLDGLSEYDVRRPLVRTGTNLLGLVKHLAGVSLRAPRPVSASAAPARCHLSWPDAPHRSRPRPRGHDGLLPGRDRRHGQARRR